MICVVTNRFLVQNESFYEAIERAALAGPDMIILREKDLCYDELLSLAIKVKAITDRFKIPLIINGSYEVAKEVKAYGYHMGYSNINSNNLKSSLKLGISVHNLKEAIEAENLGASYVIAGHVFETDCKKGLEGRGLEFIKEVSSNIKIPVIAIGGISTKNAQEVLEAGAVGVAIMSSAMKKNNMESIKDLKVILNKYKLYSVVP